MTCSKCNMICVTPLVYHRPMNVADVQRHQQAERLRLARERAGYDSPSAAIEKFGWKPSTYMAHENGQNGIRSEPALIYGRAYGVEPGWILTGIGIGPDDLVKVRQTQHQSIVEFNGHEYAVISVFDIRFAAGYGAENYEEEPVDNYVISLSLLRSLTDAPVKDIGVFQAQGDSMEPTIRDRDWVVVDRRKTSLKLPGIYTLTVEGEGLIKRASRHLETGVVTLTSDNARYKPQIIKRPDRLSVIGKVFISIRRH